MSTQHPDVDTSVTHHSGNYEPLSAAFEAAIAAQYLANMQAVHLGDGTILFYDTETGGEG